MYLRIEVHFFVCIGKWKDTGHMYILWSAKRFSKIYTQPVSFHFQMQKKEVKFNPYIYAKVTNNPQKFEKNQCQFLVTWLESFIGNYLPRFLYASSQANDIGV